VSYRVLLRLVFRRLFDVVYHEDVRWPLAGSSFRPSCSCIAVKMPGAASGAFVFDSSGVHFKMSCICRQPSFIDYGASPETPACQGRSPTSSCGEFPNLLIAAAAAGRWAN